MLPLFDRVHVSNHAVIFPYFFSFANIFTKESQGYDNGRDLNDDDYEARKVLRLRAILGIFFLLNLCASL